MGISNVRCNIDSFKSDLDLDLINLDFPTIVCRNQHAIKFRKEDPDLDNYIQAPISSREAIKVRKQDILSIVSCYRRH